MVTPTTKPSAGPQPRRAPAPRPDCSNFRCGCGTGRHPNTLVLVTRVRTLTLPEVVINAKSRAIAHFRSQTSALSDDPADQPILPPHLLDRFTGATETFFV